MPRCVPLNVCIFPQNRTFMFGFYFFNAAICIDNKNSFLKAVFLMKNWFYSSNSFVSLKMMLTLQLIHNLKFKKTTIANRPPKTYECKHFRRLITFS